MNLTNYKKTIKEVIFWKSNINLFNKKPVRVYDLPKTVIFWTLVVLQYEPFLRMSQGHIPVIKI